MLNLDAIKQKKLEATAALGKALDSNDENAIGEALAQFAEHIQDSVLAEARGLISAQDTTILAGRGVDMLTSEETKYYSKVIEAMRSSSPKAALENLDVAFPTTTMERVFEDLTVAHPLLDSIQFHNTTIMTEWIEHDHETQLARWGDLTDEIVKEITSAFQKMDMKHLKLSAYLIISNAMLDLGPAWIDRYVRVILAEAIALAIEEAAVNGTGNKMPIGMNRSVAEDVEVTGGVYPVRKTVKLDSFDPVSYGAFVADNLAKTKNGNPRTITEMILVCNPEDYLRKIMPATTVRTPMGTYVNDVLPLPTRIIQSVRMPKDRAIIGFGERYFMGVGAGTDGGKIEHSDEFRFLQHERVYRIVMYGNGKPLDDVSFAYADISELQPLIQQVQVVGLEPPTV